MTSGGAVFEKEQQQIEDQIRKICEAHNYPVKSLTWSWIPFSGNYGDVCHLV